MNKHMTNMLSILYMFPGLYTKQFFLFYMQKYYHSDYTNFFIHVEGKIEDHLIGIDSNFTKNPAWKRIK